MGLLGYVCAQAAPLAVNNAMPIQKRKLGERKSMITPFYLFLNQTLIMFLHKNGKNTASDWYNAKA
jgi:hypothetical protein